VPFQIVIFTAFAESIHIFGAFLSSLRSPCASFPSHQQQRAPRIRRKEHPIQRISVEKTIICLLH
jgi:hypothetical protein